MEAVYYYTELWPDNFSRAGVGFAEWFIPLAARRSGKHDKAGEMTSVITMHHGKHTHTRRHRHRHTDTQRERESTRSLLDLLFSHTDDR